MHTSVILRSCACTRPPNQSAGGLFRRQRGAAGGSRGLNGKSIVMTQDAFKKVTPLKFKKTQLSLVNGFEKYALVNGGRPPFLSSLISQLAMVNVGACEGKWWAEAFPLRGGAGGQQPI